MINGDELHVHLPQVVIHGGVVNDLVGDPDAFIRIVLTGFVGHGHSPLDAPAEAESLGEANVESPMGEAIVVVAN